MAKESDENESKSHENKAEKPEGPGSIELEQDSQNAYLRNIGYTSDIVTAWINPKGTNKILLTTITPAKNVSTI